MLADPEPLLAAFDRRASSAPPTPAGSTGGGPRSTRRAAIDALLDASDEPFEGRIARDVVDALPDGSSFVVASSMPVRDVESFAAPADGVRCFANRGVNGIDGFVSTVARHRAAASDGAHGRAARRSVLPPRRQRAARCARPRGRRDASWWSTTTAAASSRSSRRPSCPSTSRRCSAHPSASTSPPSPAVHGIDCVDVETAADVARRARRVDAAGGVRVVRGPHRPRPERRPPPRGLGRGRRSWRQIGR